ncbi:hypothetical protein H5410_015820 [Solanum commersonii]|uniref:Uncharacterized protein n=1 Tax=Solanum commersonii TaxID=4109 RepID=A0A9J5ZVJ3_SOLCO|nr:hypothetical protein H5410_015820 [Solanum commersonii]
MRLPFVRSNRDLRSGWQEQQRQAEAASAHRRCSFSPLVFGGTTPATGQHLGEANNGSGKTSSRWPPLLPSSLFSGENNKQQLQQLRLSKLRRSPRFKRRCEEISGRDSYVQKSNASWTLSGDTRHLLETKSMRKMG